MTPLLIAIPLTASDLDLASSLLTQINYLGPPAQHAVLFIADHSLPLASIQPILDQAKTIFPAGGVLTRTALDMTPAYPQGHNYRFETAAQYVAREVRSPWLYLDPRCVPTRRGWLVELEREYFGSHKEFMGQILKPETHGTAAPLLSSTAVYPATLPKRMLQRLIAQRGVDFEKSCAELVVPLAHPTQRIWVHALNGSNALPSPPAEAALVHTAKAALFGASLRGENPASQPVEAVPPAAAPGQPIPTPAPVSAPDRPRSAYYHCGDLGDIIYALAAIRLAAGGELLLGPRSRHTPPPANPMREDQFERFAPLLRAQPYLTRVNFIDRHPGSDAAFDLNIFRSQWGDKDLRARTGIRTLVEQHCHTLGVRERFHPAHAWLQVPNPIVTGLFTVHRSARYRSSEDNPFPWPLILKRYAGRLLFVGLPQEHVDFQKAFNVRTAFWQCYDFLEMARVIAGSLGFVGNQSFPNSLALAMGQRVLQESWDVSPDCVLRRASFLNQPLVEGQLKGWENSERLWLDEKRKEPAPAATTPVLDAPAVIIVAQPRRRVSPEPINGVIELGPQEDAFGLGDTLTLTPLAQRLGDKAVLCLPPSMQKYACLFDGLCPVRITEDYPVFPNPGNERFIESKLRLFGFPCEDGKTAPVLNLDKTKRTRKRLNEVIWSTACASRWAHIRTRPVEWWKPVQEAWANRVILREFSDDMPLLDLAAHMRAIGRYIGTNSGPWHLAMAVGCQCLVIDADECDGYNPALWRYSLPSCEYIGFDPGAIIAKLPWILGA